MPNKQEHLGVALVLAVVMFFLLIWLKLSNAIGGTLMIFFGAILPDIFEPAIENKERKAWEHRRHFHSKRALKISAIVCIVSFALGFLSSFFFWISFLAVGYVLHLLMDSGTKIGLPA
ncbi:MAG: metal-dependent hydrolase [Candidatus Pacearchaeota archaeon]|nr:metal-dependent hydrolase [Candidatus Pacearchaeota archaeon]